MKKINIFRFLRFSSKFEGEDESTISTISSISSPSIEEEIEEDEDGEDDGGQR
jgi:hypothetical protein